MTNAHTLDAARYQEQLEDVERRLAELLQAAGTEGCGVLLRRMRAELSAHRERHLLNVAFVGQYSAGKSTLLSALTGRRDIEIDADIATSTVRPYDWNGVHIVDTPGLYTERKDHDDLTYEAIRQADLLVYCITYMLFDDVTLTNFRKLAFTDGFRSKMMLVVNKMASEAGEWDALVANYKHSLDAALQPQGLDGFRVVFVDARDFLEGVEDDDGTLVEASRFDSLVRELNLFASDRGVLGRLDTPCRILKSVVEDASLELTRDETLDDGYLLLLQRLARLTRTERERLHTSVRRVSTDAFADIVALGQEFVRSVQEATNAADAEVIKKRTERDLEARLRAHAERLTPLVDEAARSLQREIDGVLESQLAANFDAHLKGRSFDAAGLGQGPATLESWNGIKQLGSRGTDTVYRLAQGSGVSVGGGLLKAGEVAGSQLHTVVYGVGKFLGHSFRPWEAVNIAKSIGNAARVGGVLLSVAALGVDLYNYHQERKAEGKHAEARKSIASQFHEIAIDTELQFERFFHHQVDPALFGEVERRIDQARRARLTEMHRDSGAVRSLETLGMEVGALIESLRHSA